MDDALNLDQSATQAIRDVQTVTSSGLHVAQVIDGIKTSAPVNHVDHRGRVFEVYAGPTDFWQKPIVYCYAFTIRTNQTKGWGLHHKKDDRYTLMRGEVLTLLYDARMDSPTHEVLQKVVLTEQGIRQLLIPAGVWHLSVNLAEEEAFLINHPTEVYVHEQPDRLLLPWDSSAIPVDLQAFFPVQFGSRPDTHASDDQA